MFSDDALEVIEGSAAGVAVRRHWADFARQYCMCAEAADDENVVKGVPVGKRWPLLWDEFLWAAAIVAMRQNPLPDDSAAASASASVEAAAGPGELALMPLLDYHNHAPAEAGGGSVAHDPERRAANVALGSRGGKPGEEVAICYGQRPSDHLFLYGGFMADVKAEHDRVRLHVAFPFKYDDDKVRARFHTPMRVSFPSLRAPALTELGNRVRALARSRCARLRVRPLEQKRPFEGLCQALQVPTEGALEIGGTGRPRAELSLADGGRSCCWASRGSSGKASCNRRGKGQRQRGLGGALRCVVQECRGGHAGNALGARWEASQRLRPPATATALVPPGTCGWRARWCAASARCWSAPWRGPRRASRPSEPPPPAQAPHHEHSG